MHDAIYNPLGLGLLQYVSKNVGMRRACGQWSLVTNADCLLSADLLRFIQHVVSTHTNKRRTAAGEGGGGVGCRHGQDGGCSNEPRSAGERDNSFYLASRVDLRGVPQSGYPFQDVVVVDDFADSYPLAQVLQVAQRVPPTTPPAA